METEEKPREDIYYACMVCGYKLSFKELSSSVSFRCPKCMSRMFVKIRPQIVKRVKAV
mgnify:FL=1